MSALYVWQCTTAHNMGVSLRYRGHFVLSSASQSSCFELHIRKRNSIDFEVRQHSKEVIPNVEEAILYSKEAMQYSEEAIQYLVEAIPWLEEAISYLDVAIQYSE